MTKLSQPIINYNEPIIESIFTSTQCEFAQTTMKTQDNKIEGIQNSNNLVSAINNGNRNTKEMKIIKQISKNTKSNTNFNQMRLNYMLMQKEEKLQVETDDLNGTKHRKFSFDEDLQLKRTVSIFGPKNWRLIATFLPGRTPRQCRDRYSNYLIPGFIRSEWTFDEDKLLAEKFCLYGPKWTYIKQYFPYRTANDIKNRYNYTVSRKINLFKPFNLKNNEQICPEKVEENKDENLEFFEFSQDQLALFNDDFQIDDFDYASLNE